VKESQRVPGYPMRYIGAKKLDEDMEDTRDKYNVDGDGERGIPVRLAKPDDVRKIGITGKPSPLK
jgi:hypothetical protein